MVIPPKFPIFANEIKETMTMLSFETTLAMPGLSMFNGLLNYINGQQKSAQCLFLLSGKRGLVDFLTPNRNGHDATMLYPIRSNRN